MSPLAVCSAVGMPALFEEPRLPLVVADIAITASGIMLTRCSPAPR
jgi:hypothetical protein